MAPLRIAVLEGFGLAIQLDSADLSHNDSEDQKFVPAAVTISRVPLVDAPPPFFYVHRARGGELCTASGAILLSVCSALADVGSARSAATSNRRQHARVAPT